MSRCEAVIYKRDTYRRTGRTKSGFELHYTRQRCSRQAKGDGLCAQHLKRPSVSRYEVQR